MVDVYVSAEQAAEDAATFFRRAIEATGVASDDVTTDCAAAYPPALAAVLPGTAHEAGKRMQQRIERDHQHLKGRLGPTRGFQTLAGARVLCAGHAFLRNLRGHFYRFPWSFAAAPAPTGAATARAWDVLTTAPLTR